MIFKDFNEKQWADGAELVFSTKRDGFKKPLDRILDMDVKYITVKEHTLIIEAGKHFDLKITFQKLRQAGCFRAACLLLFCKR